MCNICEALRPWWIDGRNTLLDVLKGVGFEIREEIGTAYRFGRSAQNGYGVQVTEHLDGSSDDPFQYVLCRKPVVEV